MNYFTTDNLEAGREYAQMMLDHAYTPDEIDDSVDCLGPIDIGVDGPWFLDLVRDGIEVLEDAD
jgi:hypothetical protein